LSEYSIFTSKSVSEGHSDNVAYHVSAAVLEAILKDDKYAHVASETMVKTRFAIVSGEVNTTS
jgi:S-adenosylmethionine synthetase